MIKIENKSLQKIFDFAKHHYADKKTSLDRPLIDHCVSVARQAEVIAQKLYQDVRADFMPDKTKESINAIVQIALLHDVLNVSACAFEHIAETATVHVAAMVADISKDFRLVETKRDMEFRGRLSQSPVGAQIVIVADIICTAKDLNKELQKNGLSSANKAKKLLAQFDADLLAIHAAGRYYILRMYVHAARNLLTKISHAIKDMKAKARMEKLVSHHTKNLRQRTQTADTAPTKAAAKAKLKKGNTRAKKHSTE